jgi:hypothetical protein
MPYICGMKYLFANVTVINFYVILAPITFSHKIMYKFYIQISNECDNIHFVEWLSILKSILFSVWGCKLSSINYSTTVIKNLTKTFIILIEPGSEGIK